MASATLMKPVYEFRVGRRIQRPASQWFGNLSPGLDFMFWFQDQGQGGRLQKDIPAMLAPATNDGMAP